MKKIIICEDCGLEMSKTIHFNKEWKYFNHHDNRNINDPSRCHVRKTEEKYF